jgi:tetratricopeptide (TPR) repeat protein
VERSLEVLTRRELISLREETTFSGAYEYIFKSTMLRDVTYDSIIKRQQRNYHAEVAHWLETVSGARAGEYNLLIAEHYEIAGENVLAANYLYRTGEQAEAVGAYVEATRFLERGLNLVKGQVDAKARYQQSALHYRLGAIYVEQGQYAAADQHLEASLNIARELGDSQRITEALVSLGQSTAKQGNLEAAKPYLQEALALARDIGDRATIASALMWLGVNATFQREFDQSEIYLLEALALARQAEAQALEARALNILGENARYQGKYAEATAYYGQALSIYQLLTNQFGIALININMGHVAGAAGEMADASAHYREALRMVMDIQAIGFALETLAGLAGVIAAGGRSEQAVELLGLILPHPANNQEMRLAAEPLLARLRTELPPETVEAALARGQKLELGKVVHELLKSKP